MRDPDVTGHRARAWKMAFTPEFLAAVPATIDNWLIHDPGVHAFWSWWRLMVVTLRDIPGVPAASLHRPGMSHEFIACACDPALDPTPDIPIGAAGNIRGIMLMPWDLCVQVGGIDDQQANEIARLFCVAVCEGATHPASDFRSTNTAMIKATASCLASGRHPVH